MDNYNSGYGCYAGYGFGFELCGEGGPEIESSGKGGEGYGCGYGEADGSKSSNDDLAEIIKNLKMFYEAELKFDN